jgi:chromosome segregation ATPase
MESNDRRASVNKDDLFKSADEFLELNGVAPTQSYLREKLGGSFSTIGPMLREWREQTETTTRSVLEMPDNVRDSALEMVGSWWQSIQSIVNDKVDAIQEKANNLVKVAQDEVGEYIEEIKRLEGEAGKVEIELSDINALLASLQLENDDLLKTRDSLSSTLKYKESAIIDLRATRTTLENDNSTQKNVIIDLEKQAAIDASNVTNALQSLADKDESHTDLIAKSDKEHAKQVSAIEKARDKQVETLVNAHASAVTMLEKTYDKSVSGLDKANNATRSQLKEAMNLMVEEIKTLKAAKPSQAKQKRKNKLHT